MRFCRKPGNDLCLDLKRKGRDQEKLQPNGDFRRALKDACKFFGQRIGGRETQAHGTACADVMCLGISEKFDVNGAQGHVARTESDEQGCGLNLRQMLLSLYLWGVLLELGGFRDCGLIPSWTEVGVNALSLFAPSSMGRMVFLFLSELYI